MPRHVVTHTPEQIARAREVHMRGGTQAAVASVLGCSQQTAGRRIAEWCWPRVRRQMRPDSKIRFVAPHHAELGAQARRDLADGLPDKHLAAPAADGDLTGRLKSLVAREMTRTEICGGPPAEVARTLASLARTLKLLSALPRMTERDEEDDVDLEEFELELARKLDALWLGGSEVGEGAGI